jgi:iron(III) transport system ATP-binding protein
VEAALRSVGILELARQRPAQMSGGQQQRVALARAIVADATHILFDEPLSNVDAKVREHLRAEILSLQASMGFAALYVTHDQVEALQLGMRVAVMRAGQIAQIAPPEEVYRRPVDEYVARFVGSTNETSGTVRRADERGVTIETAIGTFAATARGRSPAVGSRVSVMWRPECVRFGDDDGANRFSGRVALKRFSGPSLEVDIAVGDSRVQALTGPVAPFDIDDEIVFSVSPEDVLVFEAPAATRASDR